MKSFYKNQNLNLIASMAQQIVFNNSKNGKLESTNTQDAIDEISNILDEEKTMISDAWNSSTTYTVGQYCIYNDCLWKCKVQHSGQTPSEGTYWTKTQIDDEILSIKNDVSTLNSNLENMFTTFTVPIAGTEIKNYYAYVPTNIDLTKYKPISIEYTTGSWCERCFFTLHDDGKNISIGCIHESYTIPASVNALRVICVNINK